MNRRSAFALLAVLVLGGGPRAAVAVAGAAPDAAGRFLAGVDAAVAAGEIADGEALLWKFAYGFAPAMLPARFRVEGGGPLKCGTALIAEFERTRERLAPEAVRQIEAWLAPAPAGADKAIYNSPGGHFTLTYDTLGTNAVPPTDTDPANGIPDYVERVAGFCDECWTYEIDTLGFTPPPIGTGRYQINFEAMEFYGYTTPLASPPGATRITLHNTFLDFPPNTDPEGNQWGAARVTVAHEFKHASQRAGSLWTEGGWVELDATWMEDAAYDFVNDYYNYLPIGSPISAPTTPLDNAGSGGSYEDCVFQHWMTETWDNQIIVDFWNWRKTHQTEPVMVSYNQVLADRGSSVALGWPTFTAWNFLTGIRAVAGAGYGEAAAYPTGPTATLATYPATVGGSVAYLAASFVRCTALPALAGRVLVQFDGADGSQVGLTAVITRTDGSALFHRLPLDAANNGAGYLPVPLPEIAALGFVVGNGATGGAAQSWSLTVSPDPAEPLLTVLPASVSLTLAPGGSDSAVVVLANTGELGSLIEYTAATMLALPGAAAGKSIAGATVVGSPAAYAPGTDAVLALTVTNPSADDEWLVSVAIDFPPGVTVTGSTDFVGGTDGPLVTDGSTGDGAFVFWTDQNGGYGNVWGAGQQAFATVNVTFAAGLEGTVSIPCTIAGDIYGATPHVVSGLFTLAPPSGPTVTVTAPAGGELWPVGGIANIAWNHTGLLDEVRIEGSRDGGVTWETLVEATPNDGACDWPVTGPVTAHLRLRVGSLDGTVTDLSDGEVLVYDPAPWLTVAPAVGAILQGSAVPVTLGFDAAGLAAGTYAAALVIVHDAAGSPTVVPVELTVTGPPPTFRLLGNRPNPFRRSTEVGFALAAPGRATVEIVDLQGRRVRTLLRGDLPAGPATVPWDGLDEAGRAVPSGPYLVRLSSGGQVATRKMMLTK
ncbi:MAG: MXAN_6640 family putative metalloprotease [Candidatus Krumholzibacteriia bacterium]